MANKIITKKRRKLVITPREDYAYGYIIDALAGGLYPNKFHVIREYIQNSFDAIRKWKDRIGEEEKLGIKILIQKPSIVIFDNGTGMDRATLNEYRKVGFSKKKVGEFAGFRGIGKLAGISVAKKLIVTTSPFGVKEKYILTFDADAMLKEIYALKKKRENISLNDLIEKHTVLSSDIEKKEDHYTMVELHNIRKDSNILFKEEELASYISTNAPVGFNPEFEYGEKIEEDIQNFVKDYDYVDISVNGQNIYKAFVEDLKEPQHILVWNKSKTKLLAYCWYCENKDKGQIKPVEKSGLTYKYKNFSVGDRYLPRKTIWPTSSHLAFYFVGEIYICDDRIIPTSQRDDFYHNTSRESFYTQAVIISKELNRIARGSSDIRRAIYFVDVGKETVDETRKDFEKGELYLKDLSVEKIAQIVNIIDNIEKRKENIPEEELKYKNLAEKVVVQGKELLGLIRQVEKSEKVLDIGEKIKLNEQARNVYSIMIRTLKDFFIDSPAELEKIVKSIHENLIKFFSKKKS